SPSYNRSATGYGLANEATARLAALAWKPLITGNGVQIAPWEHRLIGWAMSIIPADRGLSHHPPLGRSAAGAQSLQDRGRLDADLGHDGIPQDLHGDVFSLLAGRGAQEVAQEGVVGVVQLADHRVAQRGLRLDRRHARAHGLGPHGGVTVMKAQVEELPEGRGLRPESVCQLAGNRHGRMAVDELRERAGERRRSGRRRGASRRGGRLGHLLGAPEETYGLETATLAVHEREGLLAQQASEPL